MERAESPVVIVALNGGVVGFDPATGERRFEHAVGTSEVELVVTDHRIFALTNMEELHCFEYPTGRALGSVKLPVKFGSRATMLLDGGRLYVGCGGEILCLDLDGKILWHDPLKGFGQGCIAIGVPGNVRQADQYR